MEDDRKPNRDSKDGTAGLRSETYIKKNTTADKRE